MTFHRSICLNSDEILCAGYNLVKPPESRLCDSEDCYPAGSVPQNLAQVEGEKSLSSPFLGYFTAFNFGNENFKLAK